MKKKTLSIILAIAMLACMIPMGMVSVSAEETHTHTAGTKWMTDGRAHWLKCSDENCPLNKVEDSVLEYEIAFSSYEGTELKKTLSYSEKAETGFLMGRQGKIIDGKTSTEIGRTIIPLTQTQLDNIGNKLVIVGCDDSDNNKQITVDIDCAYTYFFDGDQKVEAGKDNLADYAAFVILDNDGEDGTITGYGYYRIYNDTVSDETFVGDILSKEALRTFKAVYDTTGGANILNFYYDTKDHTPEGTIYYLANNADEFTDWTYHNDRGNVKGVNIDKTVIKNKELKSTAYMFYSMKNVESFEGAEHLDVSNVTDMSEMFRYLGAGTNKAPSKFNVVPDVSRWNTAKVQYMGNLFRQYGQYSITLNEVPDVSHWDTGNVTNMTYMFGSYAYGTTSNPSILEKTPDVSNWNTEKVTDVSGMFNSYGLCSSKLDFELNLSKWNLSNASTTGNMFMSAAKNAAADKWKVTIPKKTSESLNVNTTTKWYTTSNTAFITPATNRAFTLATN